jgi:hypothetical protein
MNPRSPATFQKPLALAAALLALAFAGLAAPTQTKTPSGPSSSATNALPPVPRSVFIIPTSPQEGKDPFFPRSMRLFQDVVVKTNALPAAIVAVELKLQGISGTADHHLAIINNRTFESGEEGDVVTSAGRVRLLCKDIKADSVRVLVNGEERILRLRPR